MSLKHLLPSWPMLLAYFNAFATNKSTEMTDLAIGHDSTKTGTRWDDRLILAGTSLFQQVKNYLINRVPYQAYPLDF